MTKKTALHDTHRALGASFTDFAGWAMPVRYSSELTEHHAVRNQAGLFDLSHMGELEVSGPGAADALDYALVGRASAIRNGGAKYSMICNEAGGIIDDLVVYRLQDDAFLIVANAANVSIVKHAVSDRIARFDAAMTDQSDEWTLLALQGPESSRILAAVTDLQIPSLKYYSIDRGVVAGAVVLLARTGYTGEDGFEIFVRNEDAASLWGSIMNAGAPYGLVPAGLACRDTLRLEAGMPLYGQELTTRTTPHDAGLGRVVVTDKAPGSIGSDALIALAAAERTQQLVGLRSSGRRSPRRGYAVVDPISRAEIGFVTSGAPSPTLGHPIAMAYVPPAYATPGTRLLVDIRGSLEPAEVVALPFYRRNR